MRFYEGDYAYEIEQVRDSGTQLLIGWRYNVYRLRPDDKILRSGDAETQQEAEAGARKALSSVKKADRKGDLSISRRAA